MDNRFISLMVMLLLLSSCAFRQQEAQQEPPPAVEGTHYVALVFAPDSSELTGENKQYLNQLAMRALREGRDIEAIKILSWADKEYPEGATEVERKDIGLAHQRSTAIKKYLEDELHSEENIATYNMAKKPGLISRLFKNDEFTVKEAIEKSGASGSRLPDGSLSYTKASKALVIIDYADQD